MGCLFPRCEQGVGHGLNGKSRSRSCRGNLSTIRIVLNRIAIPGNRCPLWCVYAMTTVRHQRNEVGPFILPH